MTTYQEPYHISTQILQNFVFAIFNSFQVPENQALISSQCLLEAELRGIESHGVARLSGYLRLIEKGRIKVPSKPYIIHESPSTASIDGDAGLGLYNANYAMDIAIEKAKACGTGWVAIKNSNHFGIAAFHAMKALEHDMIGFSFTNASPLVAPTFGKDRLLGTNPICIAVPALKEHFVLDMATSAAANGKLEIAQRKNQLIPTGWVLNKDGQDSNDPNELKNKGVLLPLGSDKDHGSHKGYGLGAMVDILSGVLSGANFGPWVPPFVSFLDPITPSPGEGLGHFVGAMRIDAFQSVDSFKKNMQLWIDTFRNSTPIEKNQRVIIPGEPEALMKEERLKHGIPLHPLVIQDLQEISKKYGVPLPI
jgi:L-2-hydroxycarboxylate dehydrogenase (NAD+)